jgi:hypothetical protein
LRFFQTVECVRRERVLGFVGVDEEGFFAVLEFDVRVRDAGLEVEDGVSFKC